MLSCQQRPWTSFFLADRTLEAGGDLLRGEVEAVICDALGDQSLDPKRAAYPRPVSSLLNVGHALLCARAIGQLEA